MNWHLSGYQLKLQPTKLSLRLVGGAFGIAYIFTFLLFFWNGTVSNWLVNVYMPAKFIASYFSKNPNYFSVDVLFFAYLIQTFLMFYLTALGVWAVASKLNASGKV